MLAESVGLRLRTGEVALAKVRGEWVAGAGGWGGEWEAGRKSPGRAYVWAGPGRCAPLSQPWMVLAGSRQEAASARTDRPRRRRAALSCSASRGRSGPGGGEATGSLLGGSWARGTL